MDSTGLAPVAPSTLPAAPVEAAKPRKQAPRPPSISSSPTPSRAAKPSADAAVDAAADAAGKARSITPPLTVSALSAADNAASSRRSPFDDGDCSDNDSVHTTPRFLDTDDDYGSDTQSMADMLCEINDNDNDDDNDDTISEAEEAAARAQARGRRRKSVFDDAESLDRTLPRQPQRSQTFKQAKRRQSSFAMALDEDPRSMEALGEALAFVDMRATFQRVRQGKAKKRVFAIPEDLSCLRWKSEKKRRGDNKIMAYQLVRVQRGKDGEAFRGLAGLESLDSNLCFSLVYRADTRNGEGQHQSGEETYMGMIAESTEDYLQWAACLDRMIAQVQQLLAYARRGATFTKCRPKRQYDRKFYLTEDYSLRWEPCKDPDARLPLSAVKFLRVGQCTAAFRKAKNVAQYEALSFSLVHGANFETLDLIAHRQKDFENWVRALQGLVAGAADSQAIMQQGTKMLKVQAKRQIERTYTLSQDMTTISWTNGSKSGKSTIAIADIKELRRGQRTESFQTRAADFDPNRCLSIIHGPSYKVLDLYVPDEDDYRDWLTGLEDLLLDTFDVPRSIVVPSRRQLLAMFSAYADKHCKGRTKLGLRDVRNILFTHDPNLATETNGRRVERYIERNGDKGKIDAEAFVDLFGELGVRPEFSAILEMYGSFPDGSRDDNAASFVPGKRLSACAGASAGGATGMSLPCTPSFTPTTASRSFAAAFESPAAESGEAGEAGEAGAPAAPNADEAPPSPEPESPSANSTPRTRRAKRRQSSRAMSVKQKRSSAQSLASGGKRLSTSMDSTAAALAAFAVAEAEALAEEDEAVENNDTAVVATLRSTSKKKQELGMSAAELRHFLLTEQKEDPEVYTLEFCEQLIAEHEPGNEPPGADTMGRRPSMFFDLEMEKPNRLTKLGFASLLMSSAGDAFEPMHDGIYQPMDRPLQHYFINSSHNTYLMGDQLRSASSVEAYVRALAKGCRCVELDLWDGPNGRPIITHGMTMCGKIPASTVIDSLNEYAFKHSSYPLILSLENHLSLDQQKFLAGYMKQVFGDKLVDMPEGPVEKLPSPEDLKNKILLKCHRPLGMNQAKIVVAIGDDGEEDYGTTAVRMATMRRTASMERLMELDDFAEEEDELDDAGEGAVAEDESSSDMTFKGGAPVPTSTLKLKRAKTRKAANKPIVRLHKDFADLIVYTVSCPRFRGFHLAKRNPAWVMTSFGENRAMALANNVLTSRAFVENNCQYLSRAFPAGSRVDSSNFPPQPLWNVGLSMCALNTQTESMALRQNQGLFRKNGGCGYVLKPAFLCDSSIFFYPHCPAYYPIRDHPYEHLTITVVSAQHLPRAKVLQPFVAIEVVGVPVDCQWQKTDTAKDGLAPWWGESFAFGVTVPELAMVRIVVRDGHSKLIGGDAFVGEAVIPLQSLRHGYRHIRLLSVSGEPMSSTLFLNIRREEGVEKSVQWWSRLAKAPIRREKNVHLRPKLPATGLKSLDKSLRDLADLRNKVLSVRERVLVAGEKKEEEAALAATMGGAAAAEGAMGRRDSVTSVFGPSMVGTSSFRNSFRGAKNPHGAKSLASLQRQLASLKGKVVIYQQVLADVADGDEAVGLRRSGRGPAFLQALNFVRNDTDALFMIVEDTEHCLLKLVDPVQAARQAALRNSRKIREQKSAAVARAPAMSSTAEEGQEEQEEQEQEEEEEEQEPKRVSRAFGSRDFSHLEIEEEQEDDDDDGDFVREQLQRQGGNDEQN